MLTNEAIALGVMNDGVPDLATILTKRKLEQLDGAAGPHMVARSGNYVCYKPGEPAFVLIDVREPHEHQICNIPYARLIPLGDLPKRAQELNPADEIVVHCKSGMRSAKAVDFLKQAGFPKVRNMKGGILAWSDKVDPSVPKY